MNFKLFCSIIVLHTTHGGFIRFPSGGNHWEYQSLILRWNHNFTDIRGCEWSYIGGPHNTDNTVISYGTKEGLEIKILGWELLDITRPCGGGIMKKNSSQFDAGHYEMRVVAKSLVRSGTSPVGIVRAKDRSVHIQTKFWYTQLIPGRDDNKTVYLGSDGKCTINLNDKYPNNACTHVHRIGRNQSEITCNKTFTLNLEDDVMHLQISVYLDIVNSGPFVFYVHREETPIDSLPSWRVFAIWFGITGVTTLVLVAAFCVIRYLRKKIKKRKNERCEDTSLEHMPSRPGSKIDEWTLSYDEWASDHTHHDAKCKKKTDTLQKKVKKLKLERDAERAKREAAEKQNQKVLEALGVSGFAQQLPSSYLLTTHNEEAKSSFQISDLCHHKRSRNSRSCRHSECEADHFLHTGLKSDVRDLESPAAINTHASNTPHQNI